MPLGSTTRLLTKQRPRWRRQAVQPGSSL